MALRRWLALLVGVALLSGGGRVSSQSAAVRVVSPADLVLQPLDRGGVSDIQFEFSGGATRVSLLVRDQSPAFQVSSTGPALRISPCGAGGSDLPNEQIPITFEALNSAGARVGAGRWVFKLGPDTTMPEIHIVSPQADKSRLVVPGETVEIVVAGEEIRAARSWQSGIHRLRLVDQGSKAQVAENLQGPLPCDAKQWKKESRFRYVVPRDARAGQLISLTAEVEDWAKNITSTRVDLVVLAGFGGIWTTKGRYVGRDVDLPFDVEAVFSFTLNDRSGAITCATSATQPSCGSARITYYPGRVKQCNATYSREGHVFPINVNGMRDGNRIMGLQIQRVGPSDAPVRILFTCPRGSSDPGGATYEVVGSIESGLYVTIPIRDTTTTVKHESVITRATGFELDHHVELYPPRQNR